MPRLTLIQNFGKKAVTMSPLDLVGQVFKTVEGADKFGLLSTNCQQVAGWMHGSMQPYGPNGMPIPFGGWSGSSYFNPTTGAWEVFQQPMLPLKPVLGQTQILPVGGDSQGAFSQYAWSWDGQLGGTKHPAVTHRERNIYLRQTIFTGTNLETFLIDCRAAFQNYNEKWLEHADLAIGRYRSSFVIPNATDPYKHHSGVDTHGCPTWLFGAYCDDQAKCKVLVTKVHALLQAQAWIVPAGHPAKETIESVAGVASTYPQIFMTPTNVPDVANLIHTTPNPEVVIEVGPDSGAAVTAIKQLAMLV